MLSNIMMVIIPILITAAVITVRLHTSLGSCWYTLESMYTDENGIWFALAENPNLVFSKDTLFDRVWGMDSLGDAAAVTVHINRLWDKLGKNKQEA